MASIAANFIKRTGTQKPLGPWAVLSVPCPNCGCTKWDRSGGQVEFRCKYEGTCTRCEGTGLVGETAEERLAQKLGGFGQCSKCMGIGESRCGYVLEGVPE